MAGDAAMASSSQEGGGGSDTDSASSSGSGSSGSGGGVAELAPKQLSALLACEADLEAHPTNYERHVQLIGLLQAVTYLKLPLIVLNILVILIELVVG